MSTQVIEKKSKFKVWLKRVGFWGFMFFLIKGLVWLGIFAYSYFWLKK